MPDRFHFIFHSAFGYCGILYQDPPARLVEILLPVKERNGLEQRIPSGSKERKITPPAIRETVALLRDYFLGKAFHFDFDGLPLERHTSLQRQVLKAVFEIPMGETRSYGDIARAVGRPRAARFVGSVMAKNPFPLLIPCHRVVKSDGNPGEFGGGKDLKERLLAHEAAWKAGRPGK